MEKWTDIFKKWWFWVIVVILTIGVILAIVLPIVYLGDDNGSNKPPLPNKDETTLQVNFDLDENSSLFSDDVVDAEIHGQLNIGLFDETLELIEISEIASMGSVDFTIIPVISVNLVFWDSSIKFERTDIDSVEDGSVEETLDIYFDQEKYEVIFYYGTPLFWNKFATNWEYELIFHGKIVVSDSFSKEKITNNLVYHNYKHSVKDGKRLDVDPQDYYKEKMNGVSYESSEYVDFDYFYTIYM